MIKAILSDLNQSEIESLDKNIQWVLQSASRGPLEKVKLEAKNMFH